MKKYISVQMQVLIFSNEDVITSSGETGTYVDPIDHVLFNDDFE